MDKNCDNCYWKDYADKHCIYKESRPNKNICDKHDFVCDTCGDFAEYKHNEKYYCSDCLMGQFDLTEVTITKYYDSDTGEYLGSDEDIEEVFIKLGAEIAEND